MKETKQRQAILDYMKEHGSISTMEAAGLGIASASKRLSEIDRLYGLKKEWVSVESRWGKTRYIRYSL